MNPRALKQRLESLEAAGVAQIPKASERGRQPTAMGGVPAIGSSQPSPAVVLLPPLPPPRSIPQ